jgi:poly-gamma-glutamate capsule biosynthesis protein CapA/YwtB (metallophosphatase superfamily)
VDDERLARRRERRRQDARRRRLAAVALVALAFAAAGGLLARGDEPVAAPAVTPPPQPPAASSTGAQKAVRLARKPAAARGRLGNGRSVTLAFAGDVHFESPIAERLASSPASVLAPIAPILRRADLAIVNLETAVTDRGVPQPKTYTFRAAESAFAALRSGGVDVANVANNHGMDYGLVGLRETLSAARRAGMPVVGAGSNAKKAYAPFRRTVSGQRIAVIGATQVLDDHLIDDWTAGPRKPGLASAKREARLERAVREARATSDTVVVFLHWGTELESCPTGVQRSLASRLVGAGADIVVGSHAHVLLGAGRLQNALVAYGLGNFVFYAFREITSQTGVLEVTVTGRRIDAYRWRPARISGGIPYPLAGAEAAAARRQWHALRSCTGLRP